MIFGAQKGSFRSKNILFTFLVLFIFQLCAGTIAVPAEITHMLMMMMLLFANESDAL